MWSMGLLDQKDWQGQWIGHDKMRQEQKTRRALFRRQMDWLRR